MLAELAQQTRRRRRLGLLLPLRRICMLYHRPNLPRPQRLVPRQRDTEHLQRRSTAAALHRGKEVQPLAAGSPTHAMERNRRDGRPNLRRILCINSPVPLLSNLPAIDCPSRRRSPPRHNRIARHSPLPLPRRSHALADRRRAPEARPLNRLNRANRPALPGSYLQ